MASPVTAPVGPEERRKQQLSGRFRWTAGALVAEIYLIFYLPGIWGSDGSAAARVAATALLVAFGAAYVLLPPRVTGAPARQIYGTLALMVVLTVPLIILMGTGATALWIYVGVAGGMLLPKQKALGLAVLLALVMIGVTWPGPGGAQWELALTLVALTLWMVGFAGNIRLTLELAQTRDELARAAVAAERERIARDLHDILGHSLTAIAVKSGLARRLVDRDPVAATVEIADVERLAREALSDVRATASGMRDVSLAGELAVAGAVLRAAGIRPVLPQAVDDVAPAGRDVFGYVVREAVTNVVRHSGAASCTITLAPDRIEIADDGRGADPGAPGDGSGLAGLTERVRAAGGTLVAGPRSDGGFAVVASVRDAG